MGEDDWRGEITAAAATWWSVVNSHYAEFSEDEQTALRLACEYINWALRPPEQVTIVHKKPSIRFAAIRLGGEEQGGV